jgi:hypothetical protein
VGNAGGIKEILCSLSDFFMLPIAELVFKMTAIMTFYKVKYESSDKIFKEKSSQS